jgi:hypothetical protein
MVIQSRLQAMNELYSPDSCLLPQYTLKVFTKYFIVVLRNGMMYSPRVRYNFAVCSLCFTPKRSLKVLTWGFVDSLLHNRKIQAPNFKQEICL